MEIWSRFTTYVPNKVMPTHQKKLTKFQLLVSLSVIIMLVLYPEFRCSAWTLRFSFKEWIHMSRVQHTIKWNKTRTNNLLLWFIVKQVKVVLDWWSVLFFCLSISWIQLIRLLLIMIKWELLTKKVSVLPVKEDTSNSLKAFCTTNSFWKAVWASKQELRGLNST